MQLLDKLAGLFPDSSRTTLRHMLQHGRVRVNGEVEKDAKRSVVPEDVVDVTDKKAARLLPLELTLLHEDRDVLVVLKANGLLTVATEREKDTTAQAYLNHYLGARGEDRVHVVHRLDRETSGVLVFAKNFHAREALKEQFADHTVDRMYIAIIEGTLPQARGSFRSHLLERRDLRMVSVKPTVKANVKSNAKSQKDAKHAITHYRTIEKNAKYSMLEVTLETGRKNQIRVHLAEAGHPIVGDQFYGSTVNPLGRLGLHAKLLGFTHPTSGERLSFTAPIPRVFKHLFA